MKTWVDEMIELEATPQRLREETVVDFCKRNAIQRGTYYYELSKKENKERVLEITLNKAKDECPNVLDTLIQKAKDGDVRAIDIYLDSVVKLAKNLDIKTNVINTITDEQAERILKRRIESLSSSVKE